MTYLIQRTDNINHSDRKRFTFFIIDEIYIGIVKNNSRDYTILYKE